MAILFEIAYSALRLSGREFLVLRVEVEERHPAEAVRDIYGNSFPIILNMHPLPPWGAEFVGNLH